jgi:hypothetical protein
MSFRESAGGRAASTRATYDVSSVSYRDSAGPVGGWVALGSRHRPSACWFLRSPVARFVYSFVVY